MRTPKANPLPEPGKTSAAIERKLHSGSEDNHLQLEAEQIAKIAIRYWGDMAPLLLEAATTEARKEVSK